MPNHLTLHEMAVAIREKELSPVELVEAHLSQIERHNPKLNVFVVLLAGRPARPRANSLSCSIISQWITWR